MFKNLDSELWVASDNSAAVILINDEHRSYYILGASTGNSTSSSVLWEAIKDKQEVDLVGCNDKKIALFKKGFGGELKPYYRLFR